MKLYCVGFLSILFLISSCSSYEVLSTATPTISFSLSEPTPTVFAEQTPELASEIVILDYALSPDGKELAVYLNTGVYLYDVNKADRITLTEFESNEYYSKLKTGRVLYYPPLDAPGALAFSPDGKEIATSGKFQDELVTIWDWENKTILKYIPGYPNGNFVRELEYSPDSSAILVRSAYPLSRLHCETGSEDSLTLISLGSRNKLFEMQGCNQWSSISFYFTDSPVMYLFHYGASVMYMAYEVDTQTGETLKSDELDTRSDGLIYDVSQSGKTFAVSDNSNLSDGKSGTVLIDAITKKEKMSLSGRVRFLNNENRFLFYTSDNQVQLQDGSNILCQFDSLEFLHSKISRDKNVLAVFTRDEHIQLWDIPSCKLINKIVFN